jgi:hypothetical protein
VLFGSCLSGRCAALAAGDLPPIGHRVLQLIDFGVLAHEVLGELHVAPRQCLLSLGELRARQTRHALDRVEDRLVLWLLVARQRNELGNVDAQQPSASATQRAMDLLLPLLCQGCVAIWGFSKVAAELPAPCLLTSISPVVDRP